ncbi:uncharacterized protein [Hoplias malabaricus]|uniref:uncharacterized protein n=1 Tax=Hoplias malabaricus TaxID=27720 RepID=UPI003462C650
MKVFECLVQAHLKSITNPLLDPLQFVDDAVNFLLQHLDSSVCRNDCASKKPAVKILKFADNATVVGLISNGEESAYLKEVEQLVSLLLPVRDIKTRTTRNANSFFPRDHKKCSTDVDQSELSTPPATKTLNVISPSAAVCEMEELKAALFSLICVFISSVSGKLVEMKVRPGEDITLNCDCTLQNQQAMINFKIVWVRRSSHQLQSSILYLTEDSKPHYYFKWNSSSFDLYVKDISEFELGMYYCALHPKTPGGDYIEGNKCTLLSFPALPCANPTHITAQINPQTSPLNPPQKNPQINPLGPQPTPTPPGSDCSSCWKLIAILSPVGFLLSLLFHICVYYTCHYRTKGSEERRGLFTVNVLQGECIKEHQGEPIMKEELSLYSEVYYTPLKSE